MNYQERKNALMAHSKEKNYWYAILIVSAISTVYALFSVIKYLTNNADQVRDSGVAIGGMVILSLVLSFGLQAIYIYAIWKLEKWVVVFMWIGLVLSIISFNLFGAIITGLILFTYKHILKTINSNPSVAPIK